MLARLVCQKARLAAAALRPFPICKPQNNFGSRCPNYAVSRSIPVVLTCSPIAAIMKTQFRTQDTMQTPQALLDSVSAFHFKREQLFSERRRCEAMSTFSGRKNSGMEIPDYAIERIARCLLPMIQAYYESGEGQAELAAWNEKKDAEDTREHDRQTA